MPVLANCRACGTSVPLGRRPFDGLTTRCPDCGSTGYDSEHVGADERERIVDLAESTPGIGSDTAEELADRMVTVDRLRDATPRELRSVPGVGQKNGLALLEQVHEGEVA